MTTPEPETGLSYWTKGVKDPRDPVGKIRLSDLMNYDPRATYKHKMLWEFHLGWSHADYDHTSLASVRKIRSLIKERSPFGKTMSIQHINEGNRDLCAWGYMRELEKGKGTKASRFAVNWDLLALAASGGFPPSVHLQGDASELAPSVHPRGDTCVTHVGDAKPDSVHPVGDKDLSTPTGLKDPDKGIDRLECAAPTAPPLAGLSAAAAETAQDEFEKLWHAYGYKKNKREARAAFKKLAPDADLFSSIITSAAAWRESWGAQGNSTAPRFRLDKWLEREEYDCEPPTAFKPKERAERKPQNETASAASPFIPRREVVTITASEVDMRAISGETILSLDIKRPDGETDVLRFDLEHPDPKRQQDSQQRFARLLHAAGVNHIVDSSELHGIRLVRTLASKFEQWDFEPANDNQPMREAA